MSTYAILNDQQETKSQAIQNICDTLKEETRELAAVSSLAEFWGEFGDVLHCLWSLIFVLLFPNNILKKLFPWYFIYFLSLGIAPRKHGIRYQTHNCIRHIYHCRKRDHICDYTPPRASVRTSVSPS